MEISGLYLLEKIQDPRPVITQPVFLLVPVRLVNVFSCPELVVTFCYSFVVYEPRVHMTSKPDDITTDDSSLVKSKLIWMCKISAVPVHRPNIVIQDGLSVTTRTFFNHR